MSLSTVRELQPFVVSDVRVSGRVLGEGSYGSVEEAEIPGATCVVKKLHEALLPAPTEAHGADRMASTFVAECRLMSTVRHPHIVQFLGVCFLPGSRLPALIMEKLLIDLHNLLENNADIPLSMKHSFLVGVSKGLTYLHTRKPAIIHRDLSARNVLLNSAMVAKIADLGNSRIVNVRPSQLMTMTKNPGNMWYMPPEVQGKVTKYNTSIDVFSFGNLSLFTLTQQFPEVLSATQTDPNTGRVVGLSEVDRRPESFSQVYRELGRDHPLVGLAEQCLHNLPSRRPAITKVLERLKALGGSFHDQYNHLNKLEMMKLHKREMAPMRRELQQKEQQLQSMQEDFQAQMRQKDECEALIKRKDDELRHQMQDYQAQLRQMDETHQKELAGLESQLKQFQTQEAVQPVQTLPVPLSRPRQSKPQPPTKPKKALLPPPVSSKHLQKQRAGSLPSGLEAQLQQHQTQPRPVSSKHLEKQLAGSLPSAATANIIIPRAVVGRERIITIRARNAKGEPHPHGGEDVQAKLTPPPEPDWTPKEYLEKVEVIQDYAMIEVDELTISIGDLIYVLKEEESGWFEGVCNGNTGVVHRSYVKKISEGSTGHPVSSNIKVSDNRDGTYHISFTTLQPGYHQLDITIEEQPIKGSPFVIYSRLARPFNSLSSSPLQTFDCVSFPLGIAVSDNGDVYVSFGDGRIVVFDESGSEVHRFGSEGSGNGQFNTPCDIALQGKVMYVADSGNHRIQKLSRSGSFMSKFGVRGDGNGALSFPRGVCLNHEGRVFVADTGNKRVSVFTEDGTFLFHVVGSSIFSCPLSLAFDPSGNLHVADRELKCVKVISPRGEYITEYGKGQVSGAFPFAINEEGYSFVSARGLSIFNPQHDCIHRKDYEFCYGVALDKHSHIFVINYLKKEIYKF